MRDDVNVSVAVMSHPERAELLPALLEALDVAPDVVLDTEDAGLWPTAERAWRIGSEQAGGFSHHLVLQDDVIPVPHLIEGIEHLLDTCPTVAVSILSLFGIRGALKEAAAQRYTFVRHSGLAWGQAVVLPSGLIEHFLSFCEESIRPDFKWDDARLSIFALTFGIPVYTTVPCLVDHLDVPSVAGNPRLAGGRHERKAAVWSGESAADMRWSLPGLNRRGEKRLSDYTDWSKDA